MGRQHNAKRALTRALMVAACVGLSACGGGGGGASAPVGGTPTLPTTPSPAPTPAPPPTIGSLVPDAPALGAVLAASALDLRPVLAGSTWQYRGRDYTRPSTQTQAYTPYDNLTSQQQSGTAVRERFSNYYAAGSDETTVRIDGTSIVNVSSFALTDQLVITDHVSTELRSPVRTGDQYVVFAQYDFDLGVDLDADRINERADIAIYRRVVGTETFTAQGVAYPDTVRVDTYNVARVRPSKGAEPAHAIIVESTWYARGIGVVKRSSVLQGSARAADHVEELVNWNGITQGIGYTQPVEVRVGTESDGTAEPLTQLAAAVAFDSHALLMSKRSASSNQLGMRVTRVDKTGRVQQSHDYPDAPVGAGAQFAVARRNDGLYIVGQHSQVNGMAMIRLNSAGENRDGPAGGIELPVGPDSLDSLRLDTSYAPAAAVVGGEVWVAWLRTYRTIPNSSDYASQLVVRPYDDSGNPLADETVVLTAGVGQIAMPKMGLHHSGALLTFSFYQGTSPLYVSRFALLKRTSGQPVVASGGELTGQVMGSGLAMPVSVGNADGLLWLGRHEDGSSLLGALTLHGVQVQSDGTAMRFGSAPNWDSEDLPGETFDTSSEVWLAARGDRIFGTVLRNQMYWPEDFNPRYVYPIGYITPGIGPWASTAQTKVILPVAFDEQIILTHLLAFDDCLLLLGRPFFSSPVKASTVWLRGRE